MATIIQLNSGEEARQVSIEGDCFVHYTKNGLQSLHFMDMREYWKYRTERDKMENPIPSIIEAGSNFRVEPSDVVWAIPLILDKLIATAG